MPAADSASSSDSTYISPQNFLRPAFINVRQSLVVATPALALVAAGAVIFGLFGNHSIFSGVDNAWYNFMLDSRTPGLTEFNQVLNFVGNTGMYIYGALLLIVLLPRHRRLALFTAAAALGTAGLTQLIKALVGRQRPTDRLVSVDSGSYPSGHVSATVAAMLATALVIGRLWMWISAAILSVAMIYSRTYLGAHWLSDTVAGALLAIGFVTLLWGLMSKYMQNEPYRPRP